MAPMTRSNAVVPRPDLLSQNSRDGGWQVLGRSEMTPERDVSEEPASSYEEATNSGIDEDDDYDRPQIESPEDHEDILHPLREAANRVGDEVESFAKALDEYNPLRATSQDEQHGMTFALVDEYSLIARNTLKRLREQHASERKKQDGRRWRKNFRGLKIAQDEDEMELEDDGNQLTIPRTTLEDLERWEEESQTWDLLQRLIKLRFPNPEPEEASKLILRQSRIHQYSTEREIWDDFLESDGLALERKTVLQWLKHTAEESGEEIDVLVHDLQQNAERGDIIAHGWLHTKAAIKNQKRVHVWPHAMDPTSQDVQKVHWNSARTEPLVTHLDPDAMTRQDRKLEPQDQYFERAIWLGCYEMLRRGKSPAEIREWCMERTEVWRAVSMSGLPDERPNNEDEPGNPASGALWRRMCFALARKSGGDEYERAVYGILSGDILSVEPVCRSWDDFVFVHYNALLRTQFDKHLQNLHRASSSDISTFGIYDAVQSHGDSEASAHKLVEALKTNPQTRDESTRPMKMIQGVLIANRFEHFIYQQGLAVSKFANKTKFSTVIPATEEQPEDETINKYLAIDDHDSLRVLTHVLLALMSLGVHMGGPSELIVIENVIVQYISFLRFSGKEELIPLYCSQLSGNRRYATLSRNLIDVTDHQQRETQISLMRSLGLDVQQFVKYQSRYLLADHPDKDPDNYPAFERFQLLEEATTGKPGLRVRRDFFGDEDEKIDKTDLLLIRSLEWYLLIDGLWSETFDFGTRLYLRFFKQMSLPAARLLAGRVPSSVICSSKTNAILGHSYDFHTLEFGSEDEDLTEVLNWSAGDNSLLRKHLLVVAKNYRELESLIESLDNMETIASMGELLHEQSERNWQKGWRQQLAKAVTPTKVSVQPLLKGWLLTSQKPKFQPEFKRLRAAYLPETILAYIKTLHFAGSVLSRDLLMECMDLSALIAEEDSDLLELFVETGRMHELVDAFAVAGKELLILTASKQGSGSKSKKLRAKGWTPDLWTVKP